ncbi:MAG: FAD-dependent oxidoreductase [Hyphomonadaceae bacterium]|nr:FAD-dependent oxidoreductase [Hyphomonadaceae bacterium]
MSATSARRNSAVRVAVIGGGVIGLSCALELKRRGAEVVVYERGMEIGAGVTSRSAGMLGAAFEWSLEADELAMAALARQAGEMWPDFAARVERLGGGGVELSAEGALVVARTPAELDWLGGMAAACQARDLPVRRLAAAELKREEPALTGKVLGGLELPGDRQVDPQKLLLRLGAALGKSGVGIRMGRAIERVQIASGFQMQDGDKFERVVLATGAGSKPRFVSWQGDVLETGLPDIVPVKGQMLALAPVAGAPKHVVHARDVYIAPKARWVLVGATTERGKADTGVDPDQIARLKAAAVALAGRLADAPEVTAWAGVRPGTPDDKPLIGETAIPGVFAAMGHYRNGILLAPVTADVIADQVLDGKVSGLAKPFSPGRFDKPAKAPHSRSSKH